MIYAVLFVAYSVYVVPQHLRLDSTSLVILIPWIIVAAHVLGYGSWQAIGVLIILPILIGMWCNGWDD